MLNAQIVGDALPRPCPAPACEPGRECLRLLKCQVKGKNAVPRLRAKPANWLLGRCSQGEPCITVAHNSGGVAEIAPEVGRSKLGELALRTEVLMSPASGKLTSGMRHEMLERGFTLMGTPRFFDAGFCVRLKKNRTVLPLHGDRWRQFPQLAGYACWLKGLLAKHPAGRAPHTRGPGVPS